MPTLMGVDVCVIPQGAVLPNLQRAFVGPAIGPLLEQGVATVLGTVLGAAAGRALEGQPRPREAEAVAGQCPSVQVLNVCCGARSADWYGDEAEPACNCEDQGLV